MFNVDVLSVGCKVKKMYFILLVWTKNFDLDVQDALESASFLEELNNELAESLPGAMVDLVEIEDEIEMDLVVTIDATESNLEVEDVNDEVIAKFEDQGFDSESESNLCRIKLSYR